MGKLTLWKFEQFDIRMVDVKGDPWFIGVDVAKALGYKNPRKAIQDHVSMNDKGVTKYDTPGGAQGLIMISESGLYSLILACKMPSAVRFKNWVTSEVLPSVRKTGAYSICENVTEAKLSEILDAFDAFKLEFYQYQSVLTQILGKLNVIESTGISSSTISTTSLISDKTTESESIDMLEFSKKLKKFGVFLGRTAIFSYLRSHKYLSDHPDNWNKPTSKYLQLKATPHNHRLQAKSTQPKS